MCSMHCSTPLLEEPCGKNDVDSKSWGLHSVGMMQSRMSDAAEVAVKNCNMTQLVRKVVGPFQQEVKKSLDPWPL